jgi:hypothetical protein
MVLDQLQVAYEAAAVLAVQEVLVAQQGDYMAVAVLVAEVMALMVQSALSGPATPAYSPQQIRVTYND